MRTQSIAIITSESAKRDSRALWQRVASAWPEFAPLPEPRFLSFAAALREQVASMVSCAVLAPDAETAAAEFHALVDALASELTAAALLAPPGWDARLTSQRDGAVVTIPADAEAAIIAAALAALLRRQRAVAGVAGELATLRRFQGGLRTEIGRMHDELQLAGKVQQQILPTQLPQTPPLAVEALFRPCGYVSGDLYDVSRLDKHRMGFFLADAMGHGVPAALMTMIISRALPRSSDNGGGRIVSPGEALARLNDALTASLGSSARFATAVYGVADAAQGTVRLAGAGHPPPLLFRAGADEPEAIETSGPLLGVFPEAEFSEVERTLQPGDVLVIYSDGVEAVLGQVHKSNEAWADAIAGVWSDLVRESRANGLSAGLESLAALLDRQAGSFHQQDDVTALTFLMAQPAPADHADAPASLHMIGKSED